MILDVKSCEVFGGLGDACLFSWLDGVEFRPATEGQRQVFDLFSKPITSEQKTSKKLHRAYVSEIRSHGTGSRLALVASALEVSTSRPEHNLSSAELQEASKTLARIGQPNCLVFPFSNHTEREWRFNYWLDLCVALKNRGVEPVLLGAELPQIDEPVANIAGSTIRQLAALVSVANVVACNDSFPLHLAGTLGTPCVAVLGPTNPSVFHYDGLTCIRSELACTGCHWRQQFRPACRFGCASLDRIDSGQVLEAVIASVRSGQSSFQKGKDNGQGSS